MVPAPRYLSLRIAAAASSPIRWRCSAFSAGEGASSSTFWWRRCSEQSRSPRCTPSPLPSPSTWISMWRGCGEILLEIDRIVAEGGLGLGAGQRKASAADVGVVDHLHAASAAAGHRLDQHRPADLAAERHHLFDAS